MRGRTALVAAMAVTGLAVGGVVTFRTGWLGAPADAPLPPAASGRPSPGPTPLASYDAEGVRVVRGPFCDRVSPTGIEHALGDVAETSTSWSNGDRVRLPDGTRDRVHEFGCRWSAPDGTEAAAWVFVPPVGRARASELVASAVGESCERVAATPAFGSPGVATRCSGEGGDSELRLAGRFGDAWLACSLAPVTEDAGVPEQVGEWCVQVLDAARG